MSDGILETVPCNVCGSIETHVRQPAQFDLDALNNPDSLARTFSSSSAERLRHQLVACARCGLQYVNPRPRADAVLQGYVSGSDEAFVSQARGRELTSEKCLDLIQRIWDRKPGRMLDIGTGGASFLHVAAKRGWQVDGCEPNRWLCQWAHDNYGLNIQPGTVFEQNYPSGAFDVVTLWDVLEHTPNPIAEIAESRRLLKPDGLIVINYPDIGSWIARAMGRSWVFLLDVHLYYFTRATIRKLLEKAGFDILRISPHFQRLSLSYVLSRATPYVGAPARVAERVVRRSGFGDWQVPYWMGQTVVIARKSSTQKPD